jgi:hypothetical protein
LHFLFDELALSPPLNMLRHSIVYWVFSFSIFFLFSSTTLTS